MNDFFFGKTEKKASKERSRIIFTDITSLTRFNWDSRLLSDIDLIFDVSEAENECNLKKVIDKLLNPDLKLVVDRSKECSENAARIDCPPISRFSLNPNTDINR